MINWTLELVGGRLIVVMRRKDATMFETLNRQAHLQGNPWLTLAWPEDLTGDLDRAVGTVPLPPALAARLGAAAHRTLSELALLAGIELTIRFERMIIGHLATVLRDWTGPDDAAMQACLARFVADEALHAETFGRYLQEADPARYGSGAVHLTAGLPRQTPGLSGPAGLIAILVLEDLFLHGQDPHLKASGTWLADLTRWHVLDESRHVRINRALVATVFGRMAPWQRRWHLLLANRAIRQASRERQVLLRALVDHLIAAHPAVASERAALHRHLASLQRPIHPVGDKLVALLAGVLAPFSGWAAAAVQRTVRQHLGPLTAFVA